MRSSSVARVAAFTVVGLMAATSGTVAVGAEPSTTPRPPGAWFLALEPGMCFDDVFTADGAFDFATLPVVVPCDQPHHNEVVAMVSMGDGAFQEGDLEPLVVELCEPEYEAFLGRPSEAALMSRSAYWPDADDWAAGAHEAVCTVYAADRVAGTARSGSLRAPGERIAVYREVDGDPDIWLVDAGTGAMTNLTEGQIKAIIDIPAWRPDGSAVAFTGEEAPDDTGIFEVPADGGEVVALFTGRGTQDGPAFSPDGSTLAWTTNADGEMDIHITDLATHDATRLTTHADRDSSPEWSPDGDRLAFRRRTDGTSDIWVMRADGTDLVQLTSDSGNNYGPRWSPDGSTILFSSDRSGNFDVWVMDADGGDQRQITTHPADDDFPAWSSDGRFIAFQSDRYLGPTLWLMRADGSDQTELTGVGPVGWARFAPAAIG